MGKTQFVMHFGESSKSCGDFVILLFCVRFRVDVRVGQPHESAIFTLWDRECCALIKETIDELKQKMIDEVKNTHTMLLYSFCMDSIVVVCLKLMAP